MDHTVFMEMSAPVRKTHAFLTDEKTFTAEIDRVIEQCLKTRLPVYIFIPMDVPSIPVPASHLQKPLNLQVKNDPLAETNVVEKTLAALKQAKKPAILADVLTIRHGGRELVREFADLTQYTSYACPLSKGIIDEDKPYYNGVYSGKGK